MKRSETIARLLVTAACLAAVIIPLATRLGDEAIEVHAKMAESGGWTPEVIQAEAGQPLKLKLTSDDVVHGFAVGKHESPAVDVEPGKTTHLELVFDSPGTYTFYCTRWCGLNHWRMRGKIEVSGEASSIAPPGAPLYQALQLDIDKPHPAQALPMEKPDAQAGNRLLDQKPELIFSVDPYFEIMRYRAAAPAQVFQELRSRAELRSLSDQQIWNLVAVIWQRHASPDELQEGAALYAQNCAACHGETGAGDGVFSDDLAVTGNDSMQAMAGSHSAMIQKPANLIEPSSMLGASPALLQGKILRGGMGTGMPMWGDLFTDQQMWQIVSYLYSFLMKMD